MNDMINIVNQRVDEMSKDSEIRQILKTFNSSEEAQQWLIKAAIATLLITK